jgi:hypothetical protein
MSDPDSYCRELEAYLCRKNDGHLIRIVGPAFEQVTGWAREGIPVKVACAGIDRYFERYYRKGPRRRPVRIEFCEADVLDAFDEWRRAVGVTLRAPAGQPLTSNEAGQDESEAPSRRRASLASHIERAVARLTAMRASSHLAHGAQEILEDVVRQLDLLQPDAKRLRGQARDALVAQLALVDRKLLNGVLDTLDEAARSAAEAEAKEALSPFRDRMPPDAYQRACTAAFERSVRDRFGLPTLAFD